MPPWSLISSHEQSRISKSQTSLEGLNRPFWASSAVASPYIRTIAVDDIAVAEWRSRPAGRGPAAYLIFVHFARSMSSEYMSDSNFPVVSSPANTSIMEESNKRVMWYDPFLE